MTLAPRLDLRQSQSLVMTPQLQQAIKLLALSNVELEGFIAEELEKNPLLSSDGENRVVEAPEALAKEPISATSADELISRGTGEADAPLDVDFQAETFHHDGPTDSAHGSSSAEAIDFDSFAAHEETLCEHLMRQAEIAFSPREMIAATQLINDIGDAGYLESALIDHSDRLGIALAELEGVLATIQTFDPTGVGARSLAECLALQAKDVDRYDPCMALLIDNLELLALGRIAQLQRMCGVDDEDMADMIRELRSYDPKPGLRFGASSADVVVPDVIVTPTRSGWSVEINAASLPRVLVNQKYRSELTRGAKTRETRMWLNENVQSANWLVRALEQRQQTIIAVATELVRQQQGFFTHGVAGLKPLTLKMIAEAVDLHESTVSRVTSNKYLSCPRGVLELKYFFTGGIAATDGGEAASALSVKAAIKALIAQEAADDILSDDTLVELLREKGFDLARRTVAKYREAIGIGSSVQRRRARAIATKVA